MVQISHVFSNIWAVVSPAQSHESTRARICKIPEPGCVQMLQTETRWSFCLLRRVSVRTQTTAGSARFTSNPLRLPLSLNKLLILPVRHRLASVERAVENLQSLPARKEFNTWWEIMCSVILLSRKPSAAVLQVNLFYFISEQKTFGPQRLQSLCKNTEFFYLSMVY